MSLSVPSLLGPGAGAFVSGLVPAALSVPQQPLLAQVWGIYTKHSQFSFCPSLTLTRFLSLLVPGSGHPADTEGRARSQRIFPERSEGGGQLR